MAASSQSNLNYDSSELPEIKAVSDGNTDFSVSLFNELRQTFPNNLIYSPFSLSAVVAMAQLGARGDTAQEIASTFGFPTRKGLLGKGYNKVLASLQATTEGYTLVTANRLYTNIGFGIKPTFAKGVKDNFMAEVKQLNFAQNVASAASINGWVEETTHGKIRDLVKSDGLEEASLILVNGIYFKGLWSLKFQLENTKKVPFFLSPNNTVPVDMMRQTAKILYGTLPDIGAHAVALPYKGKRLFMVIIVPMKKGENELVRVEKGMRKYTPVKIFDELHDYIMVEVLLPRFKMESELPLGHPLKKMGLSAMFDAGCADFSGIPAKKMANILYVTNIFQKAAIEVNEEGSEAAAATCTYDSNQEMCRTNYKNYA